jgi:integrase
MRQSGAVSEWVFPASTKSGHSEQSTLRKQHAKARELAEFDPFPLPSFRHTCLTLWSQHMDPYMLAYFAGHSDFATTRRYVHPNLESDRAAMEREAGAQGGHNSGQNAKTTTSTGNLEAVVLQ